MSQPNLQIPTTSPEQADRLIRRMNSKYQHIWTTLDSVYDPEIPGMTIWDLGILQDVQKTNDGWLINITLTYSGCPAVGIIKEDIIYALKESGITATISVNIVLTPCWSTDFISPAGRQQLLNNNITPPVTDKSAIKCPNCESTNTGVISEFGSTACKALYRCNECLEPFDYFKRF